MSPEDATITGAPAQLDTNARCDDSGRKATRSSVPSSCCSSSLRGGTSLVTSSSALCSVRGSSRGGEWAVRQRERRARRARRRRQAGRGGAELVAVPYVNAPHVPLLPSHATLLPIVLDPFPNAAILSIGMIVDTLLTAQRTGVRLYRRGAQCEDSRATAAPMTGTPRDSPGGASQRLHDGETDAVWPAGGEVGDAWGLVEARDGLQLQDAYLSCIADVPSAATCPTAQDATVADTPYARYFCVATGSDRTLHSVCVMSTRGHFVLHHELHGHNKVVCMYFALCATRPLQPHVTVPLVVSVDEIGEVVLYDMQRRSAARLQRHSGLSSAGLVERIDVATEDDTTDERVAACEQATLELLDSAAATTSPYRLESGVATRVVLVGPCVELCTHCHNFFCPSSAASRQGEGFIALSLLITSRARDVMRSEHHNAATVAATASSFDEAELHVTFVRLLWDRTRAFVVQEADVVRETAPVAVCEAGVAMCVPPYRPGRSQTVLLARPRLRLWRLSGCTGRHLQTLRVYDEEEGSGHGSRAGHEYFLDWLLLGRHTLQVSAMSASAAATQLLSPSQALSPSPSPPQPRSHAATSLSVSWDCVVATTEDNSVLLLGAEPMPTPMTASVSTAAAAAAAAANVAERTPMRHTVRDEDSATEKDAHDDGDATHEGQHTSCVLHGSTAALTSPQRSVGDLPGGLQERQQLEAWLGERSPGEAPTTPPPCLDPEHSATGLRSPDAPCSRLRHDGDDGDGQGRRDAARLGAGGLTRKAYTVLVQLYSAAAQCSDADTHGRVAASVMASESHEAGPTRCHDARTACGGVKAMYYPRARALLLFLRANETILQLSLPFLPAAHASGEAVAATSTPDSRRRACSDHGRTCDGTATQSAAASHSMRSSVAVAGRKGASAPSAARAWPFSLSRAGGEGAGGGHGAGLVSWAPSVRLAAPLQRWLAEGNAQSAGEVRGQDATTTPRCLSATPPAAGALQAETRTTSGLTLPHVLPSLDFSLVRPLASAVLRWTEGGTDQTLVTTTARNTAAAAQPSSSDRNLGSPVTAAAPSLEGGSYSHSPAAADGGEGEGGEADARLETAQDVRVSTQVANGGESATQPSSLRASELSVGSTVTGLQDGAAADAATQSRSGRRTCSPSVAAVSSSSFSHGRVAAVQISIRTGKSGSRRRPLRPSSMAALLHASCTTGKALRNALSVSSSSAPRAGASESRSLSALQRGEFVRQQVRDMLRPPSLAAPPAATQGGRDTTTAPTVPNAAAAVPATTTCACSDEPVEAAHSRAKEMRRLVLLAEPRARQAIVYAWQDGHDALYIRRSMALDKLEERNVRRRAVGRALSMRCERHVWADLVCLDDTATTTHANVSVCFFAQFSALRAERLRTRSRRGLFAFACYFATDAVPQPLRDLQERDKCKFELADLQLRQQAELAALDPYETVTLYQNEEKRPARPSASRLTWQPHATFAFDDADGKAVDLVAYNASAALATCRAIEDTAATTSTAATAATSTTLSRAVHTRGGDKSGGSGPGAGSFFVAAVRPRGDGATRWAWATQGEPSSLPMSSSRTKVLARELQQWHVGPWRYAAQWPSHRISKAQDNAIAQLWTDEERADSRVRRRSLTRRRLDLTVEAAREQLAMTHARQLEALRQELGL